MLRICRKCRTEYHGDPGSTLCPCCVLEQRKTTIRTRICRTCEIEFPGGPRAWYCPSCRSDRKKKLGQEYRERRAVGKQRFIGSEDICCFCGKAYIVSSGNQRYCPDCAPQQWAEADRKQAREYYTAHGDPNKRNTQRKAHSAELLCSVCGKPYIPSNASKTCSATCSAELARRNKADWEKAHREERNQKQKASKRAKLDRMTPQEREAYREKINEAARINYHKAKHKEDLQ